MALTVFAIVGVSLISALNETGKLANMMQREVAIVRILDSALTEALSMPTIEEGTTTRDIEEHEMEIETIVELLELENEDGQALQQMYKITVIAYWYDEGQLNEQSAETYRYASLYQL